MKLFPVILLAISVSGCSRGEGVVASHVPIKVAGITYQWPYDGSEEIPAPKKWLGGAWLSTGMWNEVIGSAIPALQRKAGTVLIMVNLRPASARSWNIGLDGTGLPTSPSERFEPKSKGNGYVVGKVIGPGTPEPLTTVVFDREPNAYLMCSDPSPPNPRGTCALLINDRGVEHSQTVPYGLWAEVRGMLPLYRRLVGIPNAFR